MIESKLLNEGERLAKKYLNRSPNVEAEIKRCHAIANLGAAMALTGLAIIIYILFVPEYSNASFGFLLASCMVMGGSGLASNADLRLKMYKVSLYAKSLQKK